MEDEDVIEVRISIRTHDSVRAARAERRRQRVIKGALCVLSLGAVPAAHLLGKAMTGEGVFDEDLF